MNVRSIAAAFLMLLWTSLVALGAGRRDGPQNGGPFPDDVERGMMIDALQMPKYPEMHLIPEAQMHRGVIGPTFFDRIFTTEPEAATNAAAASERQPERQAGMSAPPDAASPTCPAWREMPTRRRIILDGRSPARPRCGRGRLGRLGVR